MNTPQKCSVFNDQIDYANFSERQIKKLQKSNIKYYGRSCNDEDDLIKYAKDADIILSQGVKINLTEKTFNNLSKLKAVVRRGIGCDNIDANAAYKEGIWVCNTPGFCREEISTHAIGLLIGFVRKIPQYHNIVKEGKWTKENTFFGHTGVGSIVGETIGLIGFGNTGKLLYKKLKNFESKFLVYDPYIKIKKKKNLEQVTLEYLLEESKYIIICCTLTKDNVHLLDKPQFESMKKNPVIINVARGKLINEKILISYLKTKEIEGACLDVFEDEPLDINSPLLKLENVILSPHNAGASSKARDFSFEMCLQEILRIAKGQKPKNLIN